MLPEIPVLRRVLTHRYLRTSAHYPLSDTVDQSRLLNTHCGLGSTVIKPEGYNLSPQEIVKYVMDYREVC